MKKTKTLHLITAVAASAVLAFSGCSINESPDYGQTTSETVTSGSLSVTADKVNLDPGDTTGVAAEFTLSLTGTTFAFGAEADADLSGYITIKGFDANGKAVSTLSTGKIRAKEAFNAGAKTVKVYTTIADEGEIDVAGGSLKVSISSGALNASGKVTNADAGIDILTCTLTAIDAVSTSTSEKLGTISGGVLNLAAGADLNTQKVTFFLVPKGKTAGYTYKNTTDTAIDFSVIDKTGNVSTALGASGSVTAKAATRDGVAGIDITLSGADTGSWITNYGSFEFEIPASDLVKGDKALGSSSEVRIFTTTAPVWKINGVSIVLSGDGVENAAAGYGTVGATVTTGEITVTVENGITVNSLTAADTATGFTFTGALVSGSTDTYTLTSEEADLSSSADNLSGTLAFTLNATISNENYDIPLEDTVDYTLSYKSYLETPTAAQVILATGGSTTEEVYTTVINLAAFDKRLPTAPSSGATVATGTIGSTEISAVALDGATTTNVPVKIAYTGDAPTGAVTLTLSADESIVVKQTDLLHFATGLLFVQDFENVSTITDVVGIQDSTRVTSELADATGDLASGKMWRHYYVDANGKSGTRVAWTTESISTPTSGKYVMEFDAAFTRMSSNCKDWFAVTTAQKKDGNNLTNSSSTKYLFYMAANTPNGAGDGTWNIQTSESETFNVALTNGGWNHYKLTVDVTNSKAYITISDTSVENQELYVQGGLYAVNGLTLGTGLASGMQQCVDNIVVYSTN